MVIGMSSQTTLKPTRSGWNFDNSYTSLPDAFYIRQHPLSVRESKIVTFNEALAKSLGLDPQILAGPEGQSIFAGNQVPPGAEPIAQAYAGHQFGFFALLGDGRAILLGEQIAPDGKRFDIQLKGAGRTPFSRGGDGRAALGPMLREYIISEALHALGIPTTRSLAVVTTGEPVYRETTLPGAILTRVAASHIRVGTFQYAMALDKKEALQALTDYVIQRHYPEVAKTENPYLEFLKAVMERQASLVAKWRLVGFIHGVMNTDNMAISGETIDYGPCAFMDAYDPATVFSSIDTQGRYAYINQPQIAQWNLARFAETLLPLLHSDSEKATASATEMVIAFPERFHHHWFTGMRGKLGLFNEEPDDVSLVEDLLRWMHQNRADFTNTFRTLSAGNLAEKPECQGADFSDWYVSWQARLHRQPQSAEEVKQKMQAHNPAVIPRNHKVEEALKAAVENQDFNIMHKLLSVLANPYSDVPMNSGYSQPAINNGIPYKTFCGT